MHNESYVPTPAMTSSGCTIPNFKLNGIILHVVASYKYIGDTLQMIFLVENVGHYLFK